ncbi:hypothetical protein NPIL_371771 [Nephila pilipes]|uniref:Uncharacterized protein n=1 Tax=Nephila pilipes TaxID=299642 RepID=A0A8X6N972_NEPPI|nr:hypothetical protein NPIL_371771 [Nephila pilipes]
MFVATSMASELVPASVILFRVVQVRNRLVASPLFLILIPILGKAAKKIVCDRKSKTIQTDSENTWKRRSGARHDQSVRRRCTESDLFLNNQSINIFY